jgi:hypothetical protein
LAYVFCILKVMTKQGKSVHEKSMGRPPGIKYGGTIPARFEIATMEALDVWAQEHGVSRSEAIRRLVEIGLSKPSARPQVLSTSAEGAARAAEIARKADNRTKKR